MNTLYSVSFNAGRQSYRIATIHADTAAMDSTGDWNFKADGMLIASIPSRFVAEITRNQFDGGQIIHRETVYSRNIPMVEVEAVPA